MSDRDERVQLSRFELTMLSTQYRILEKLTALQIAIAKSPGESLTHELAYLKDAVRVFEHGYEYDYAMHLQDGITQFAFEDGQELWHVLEMFEALRRAGSALRFEGFGRGEFSPRSYTERFAASQRFEAVLRRDPALVESHWEAPAKMLPRYCRMLMVYRDSGEHPLSQDAVRKLEAVAAKSD
jgi:hypothetical protein